MPTLRLKGLECERTTTGEGIDEIRLEAVSINRGPAGTDVTNHGRIFAGNMDEGSARNIEWARDFNYSITITMREYDRIGRDDTIDALTIHAGDPLVDNPYRRNPYSFMGHGAHYLLYYDLIDPDNPPETFTLELHSLACNDAQQRTDHTYIAVDGQRVWGPAEMRTGRTLSLGEPHGVRIPFIRGAHITLWEEDPAVSDNFGRQHIDTTVVTERPMVFHRDRGIVGDARYTLTYSVRRGWP